MQKIKYLIRKEFIQVFRDKAMLRVIFLMPVIQLLILGYAITTDVKRIPLVVYDQDNSLESRGIDTRFRAVRQFSAGLLCRGPENKWNTIWMQARQPLL